MTNYPTKKLGEVCEINMGQSPTSSTYNNNQNGLPFYQGKKDYGEKYPTPRVWCSNPIKIVEAGDILISVRAPVGALNIAKEKSCIGRGLAGLRAKKELGQVFLFRYLQLKEKEIASLGTGSTFTAISKKHLENLQISLPPIAEQKKIVARLESVLGKIKEAKKLREEAESAAESLLPAELHKIFEEGKKKGWEEKELGDETILKMTSGGTPSRANRDFYNGSIVWLKSGELEDNTNVIDSEEKISEDAIKESSAKIFPKGTILFAMYGATAGKLGILGIDASTNQAVAGMIPVVEKLNNKFLYYFLLKQREKIISQAWGGAQPNLSQTIIKKFKIPLPTLAEQEKIVERLDALNEKIKKLREYQRGTKSDMESLERSVLHQAFAGK